MSADIRIAAVAAALALVGSACGDDAVPEPVVVGPCDATVTPIALAAGAHVEVGTPITWSSNPPTSGPHYPAWAGWDRSYDALDRGYWVHNAEHGGVILLHRCATADCAALVAQLVEVARTAPIDPACQAPLRNRVLVVADPLLPEGVEVAATAWSAKYTARCFDDSLREFTASHLGRGPEDTCANGITVGGTFIDP
jgi:hypothetical protein